MPIPEAWRSPNGSVVADNTTVAHALLTGAANTWVQRAALLIWHMDFGMWTVIVLVLHHVWFRLTRKRKMPWYLQSHSLMYFGFAVLLLLNFAFTGMIWHTTGCFNNETIKEFESPWSDNNTTWNDWVDKADLTGYDFLKYFSMSLPFFLLLNFAISFTHTLRFLDVPNRNLEMRHATGAKLWKRDCTVVIIALPFVYGFMAFWSVQHMWQITASSVRLVSSHTFHSIDEAVEIFSVAYEATFGVAHAFEAFALWLFAKLLLNQLQTEDQLAEAKVSDDVKDIVSEHLKSDWEKLRSVHREMNTSASGLAMGGIRWFCISCIATALCDFIPEQLYFIHGSEHLEKTYLHKWLPSVVNPKTLSGFFSGMGTVASFAAIENLLILEFKFGHTLLKNFNGSKKFWSVKVLVSIAFFQELILFLPPVAALKTTRMQMLYASWLSFECFLISVFHFLAWDASEVWYNDPKSDSESEKPVHAATPLLAGSAP